MFMLFAGWLIIAEIIFTVALLSLMVSLALSLREVQVSVDALNYRLSDIEELQKIKR
jgi:uncharacterized protein YoxC